MRDLFYNPLGTHSAALAATNERSRRVTGNTEVSISTGAFRPNHVS
jgi:hypothetical protein